MLDLDTAREQTREINATFRDVRVEAAKAALRQLALAAKAIAPDARYVQVEWSDQGPWLEATDLLDEFTNSIDTYPIAELLCDIEDLDGPVTSLGEDNQGVWAPYSQGALRFDLDRIITDLL